MYMIKDGARDGSQRNFPRRLLNFKGRCALSTTGYPLTIHGGTGPSREGLHTWFQQVESFSLVQTLSVEERRGTFDQELQVHHPMQGSNT